MTESGDPHHTKPGGFDRDWSVHDRRRLEICRRRECGRRQPRDRDTHINDRVEHRPADEEGEGGDGLVRLEAGLLQRGHREDGLRSKHADSRWARKNNERFETRCLYNVY